MNSKISEKLTPNTALVSPEASREPARGHFVRDLKLMFAALGAGGSVVPMGDNGRATRQLALYADCLNSRP
jgi:hypothetical protein